VRSEPMTDAIPSQASRDRQRDHFEAELLTGLDALRSLCGVVSQQAMVAGSPSLRPLFHT